MKKFGDVSILEIFVMLETLVKLEIIWETIESSQG